MYLALGVGIGLVSLNLMSRDPVIRITPDNQIRKLRENSILHEAWRNGGQFLTHSGHPDEHRYKYRIPLSVPEVMMKSKEKLAGREFLLNSSHFNTGVLRRTQFKTQSDTHSWPTLYMGSGWYVNAVQANKTPYVSRIIPWTAPW